VSCEGRKERINVKEKGRKREKRGEREMLLNAVESKTQGSGSKRTLKTLPNPYKLSYC